MKLLSRVWLFATPWTVAYQAPHRNSNIKENFKNKKNKLIKKKKTTKLLMVFPQTRSSLNICHTSK